VTTALTEYPGLEAKAQKVFDMPYSELALHFQKAVRSLVAKDAAEEMLESLKFAQEILKDQAERFHKDCRCQLCESCLQSVEAAIAKAEGRPMITELIALVDRVRDRNEPRCQVCTEPLYLHNEPCEREFSDDAMVSREREAGLR